MNRSSNCGGGGGGGGRKSSLTTYTHVQNQQLATVTATTGCTKLSGSGTDLHLIDRHMQQLQQPSQSHSASSSAVLLGASSPARRFAVDVALQGLQQANGGAGIIGGGTLGRLSIHSGGGGGYEATTTAQQQQQQTTCCLPPPSPAPNNDRYVLGMPAPAAATASSASSQAAATTPSATLAYAELKFSAVHHHHRSMSPSSR